MFGGVHGQRDGPEAVVMRPIRVVEMDLAGLDEFVAFYVEFVE